MDFELYLEREDGSEYVERFSAQSLEGAWVYAASFMGRGFRCVKKMINLSALRGQQLRPKVN